MTDQDQPDKPLTWIVGSDGEEILIDKERFDADVKRISAGLLLAFDESKRKHLASQYLAEIHVAQKSPDYTRVVLHESLKLMSFYLAEEANTFQMPIILKNINHLLLMYRRVRPDENGVIPQ
ncbi:hypothetical protein NVV95_11180 [Herbiconiux sp. CPCC 205716]|uniref:Uncharacterized protein n=1 Tax=Herbiconiux gentiana TaxID=2970912 RepID=A0ABT2GJL7_9MICO|nr:hypothetical protein [Herbiconiux gentiana]MCS5715114.1 hypothetical protein [Herbiconiux gentiana]